MAGTERKRFWRNLVGLGIIAAGVLGRDGTPRNPNTYLPLTNNPSPLTQETKINDDIPRILSPERLKKEYNTEIINASVKLQLREGIEDIFPLFQKIRESKDSVTISKEIEIFLVLVDGDDLRRENLAHIPYPALGLYDLRLKKAEEDKEQIRQQIESLRNQQKVDDEKLLNGEINTITHSSQTTLRATDLKVWEKLRDYLANFPNDQFAFLVDGPYLAENKPDLIQDYPSLGNKLAIFFCGWKTILR